MPDVAECPYCEHDNDMTDGLVDLSRDNTFDHECANCGESFEISVVFDPRFISRKIEFENCDRCGTEERDIRKRGRVRPFPDHLDGDKFCKYCYLKGIIEVCDREVKRLTEGD